MSVHLTSRAWKAERLSMTQKIVLVKLADTANDQGVGWPSIPTIALECSCSERAVFNAIRELEFMGHIRRAQRAGNSTLYHVHPCTTFTPEPDAPPQDVHPTPATGSPPPLHHVQGTPAPRSPKPSRTVNRTVKEPSKANPEVETILPYPSKEFADAWAAWLDHKKEIRQKMPESTKAMQLKNLAKWGESAAIQSVENSIANKWQGLFEPKPQANTPKPKFTRPGIHEDLTMPTL